MTHTYHEAATIVSGYVTTASRRERRSPGRLPVIGLLLGCALSLIGFFPADGFAKTKAPRAPRPEPELKILDLAISPTPFVVSNGSLEFSVTIQLPKELDSATVLEVSSLISSPSKTSLRFLSQRKEVQPQPSANGNRQTVSIRLTWDGQDQSKQQAPAGTYSYEVRTKLLTNGEKGLRTSMVAWPKRGTLEVR